MNIEYTDVNVKKKIKIILSYLKDHDCMSEFMVSMITFFQLFYMLGIFKNG